MSVSWRGASLSQAKPLPSWPTWRMPPAKSIQLWRLGRRLARRLLPCPIGRPQRTGGEQRQDIGEQQLLMLLLVVDADLDQSRDLGARTDAPRQQLGQRLVHVRAVGQHLLARRPREHAALRARLPRALALVVGIEAIVEGRVEDLVARQVLGKDEGLEEPGDVRQVPLGRARIVHRLDRHVLGRERLGELEREAARLEQALLQGAMRRSRGSRNRRLSTHLHPFSIRPMPGVSTSCPVHTGGSADR